MIYQELALAPHLSVEANVMLGQERVKAGLVRRREHRRLVAEALGLLEHPDIRPEAMVGTLSVGAQQLVEVARALVSNARVIVFDEPTSSLTEHDAERLFEVIERLAPRAGHRLHQPFPGRSAPDRPALHRASRRPDGRLGADGRDELKSIIAPMVGRDLTELFPHVPHTPVMPVLELSGLAPADRLEVRRPVAPSGRDPGHRGAGRRGPDRIAPGDLRARRRSARGESGSRG